MFYNSLLYLPIDWLMCRFISVLQLYVLCSFVVTLYMLPSWPGRSLKKRDLNLNEAFTWLNKGYIWMHSIENVLNLPAFFYLF